MDFRSPIIVGCLLISSAMATLAQAKDYERLAGEHVIVNSKNSDFARNRKAQHLVTQVRYGNSLDLPANDLQTIRNTAAFTRADGRAILGPYIQAIKQTLASSDSKSSIAVDAAEKFHEARQKEHEARSTQLKDLIGRLSGDGQRIFDQHSSEAQEVQEIDLVSLARENPDFVIAWLQDSVDRFFQGPAKPSKTDSADQPSTELGIHGGTNNEE